MKVTRFLLSALLLGAMATTASAQGAVSINWDSCVGPINKQIAPGVPGTATPTVALFASVINHSQPHQAYRVDITLGSAGGLRDAWRFDAAGCQGSLQLVINHLGKSCPSFQGALSSIQVKDYSYDSVTGKARAVLANTYPAGQTVNVNPAQRYFLAEFRFNHEYSVNGAGTPGETCGGLEAAVCAHVTRATWLTLGGQEIPWAVAGEYVTAQDPANAIGCPGATPAENKTWGSVKHQYKR